MDGAEKEEGAHGLGGKEGENRGASLRSPGAPLASRASPADWAIVGGHFDHWVQRAIVGGRSPFGDRSRPLP